MRVGFIGLGRMGLPMAHRIATAFPVCGTDRDHSRAALCETHGIGWCPTPSAVMQQADVVFVLVGTESQVEDVFCASEGLLAAPSAPRTVILASTLRPAFSKALAESVAATHPELILLDGPIARGEQAAREGQLLMFLGGDRAACDVIAPVIACVASESEWMGPIGSGQVAKMINNYLLWACLTASVEGLDLGEAEGLDREQLRRVLMLSSGDNWALRTRADERPALWAEKDMAIVLDEAQQHQVQAPVAAQVREAIKAFKHARGLPPAPSDPIEIARGLGK